MLNTLNTESLLKAAKDLGFKEVNDYNRTEVCEWAINKHNSEYNAMSLFLAARELKIREAEIRGLYNIAIPTETA